MFTHGDIWRAIDLLADKAGYSASGLAKKAGLDPTTFNRSKRTNQEGKPRWPSTESIAKILGVTGTTMSEFLALMAQSGTDDPESIPLLPPGANVILRRDDGGILTGLVRHQDHDVVVLDDASGGAPHTIKAADIAWIAQTIWEKP